MQICDKLGVETQVLMSAMESGFKDLKQGLHGVQEKVEVVHETMEAVRVELVTVKVTMNQLLEQRKREEETGDVLSKFLIDFWKTFVHRRADKCPGNKFVEAIVNWFKANRCVRSTLL